MAKSVVRTPRAKSPPLPKGEVLRPGHHQPHPFDDYLGAKVITLATLLRRSTALRHQQMFGMTLVESRAILRIGVDEPLSLDELAAHIAIGKSQTSRVVSALVSRGLVDRNRSKDQARGLALTLSKEGHIVNRALVEAASLRNADLTDDLDPKLLAQVSQLLDILIGKARTLLSVDQSKSRPAGAAGSEDIEEFSEEF